MPRARRVWLPHCFYHIVCRGNRRDPLFLTPTDFEAFFHILEQIHEEFPFEVVSYCLMTNHYHLQLRSQEVPISKIMAMLNKRYANYYNTKYCLTGHVFEKRFFDKLIVGRVGMLEVSRYIHLNPVEASMVKRPEHYPWSSFHLYLDESAQPARFMNLEILLDYYAGSLSERRESYGACHSPVFLVSQQYSTRE